MELSGKNCTAFVAPRRTGLVRLPFASKAVTLFKQMAWIVCRQLSRGKRIFPYFLLSLVGLLPVVGVAQVTVQLPFMEEKQFGGQNQTSSGYLGKQSSRQVPLVDAAELEKAPAETENRSDRVSFKGFLEQMEAQLAAEKAGAQSGDTEEAGETTKTASNSGSAEDKSGENGAPDANGKDESSGMQRETIASTESEGNPEPAYVFPKPERDTKNFEDIFLYFPIESGDMQKLGLTEGVESGSRFTPPQSSDLKSRAIFEQIER